jgi:hypothetical protein
MSCKITTAPINLPTGVNEEGAENTDFTYNYGVSSCSITNKTTYLDISCFDGINQIQSGLTGDLYVSNVRLYKPSLNSYDNRKADAELIITHSGGGKNLYICIPITSTTASGGTVEWFRQIIPFSPSKSGSSKSINVSNFTLNSIIPKATFIVYDGGTFDWGCSKQDVMILFALADGVNMSYRDLRTVGNIIKPASYNVLPVPDYLKFNKRGTIAGPGKKAGSQPSDTLTCTPITDQDGKNIENPDNSTWVQKTKNSGDKLNKNVEKYWQIILGVLLGIVVLGLIIFGIRKAISSSGGSSGGNTTPSGGSG